MLTTLISSLGQSDALAKDAEAAPAAQKLADIDFAAWVAQRPDAKGEPASERPEGIADPQVDVEGDGSKAQVTDGPDAEVAPGKSLSAGEVVADGGEAEAKAPLATAPPPDKGVDGKPALAEPANPEEAAPVVPESKPVRARAEQIEMPLGFVLQSTQSGIRNVPQAERPVMTLAKEISRMTDAGQMPRPETAAKALPDLVPAVAKVSATARAAVQEAQSLGLKRPSVPVNAEGDGRLPAQPVDNVGRGAGNGKDSPGPVLAELRRGDTAGIVRGDTQIMAKTPAARPELPQFHPERVLAERLAKSRLQTFVETHPVRPSAIPVTLQKAPVPGTVPASAVPPTAPQTPTSRPETGALPPADAWPRDVASPSVSRPDSSKAVQKVADVTTPLRMARPDPAPVPENRPLNRAEPVQPQAIPADARQAPVQAAAVLPAARTVARVGRSDAADGAVPAKPQTGRMAVREGAVVPAPVQITRAALPLQAQEVQRSTPAPLPERVAAPVLRDQPAPRSEIAAPGVAPKPEGAAQPLAAAPQPVKADGPRGETPAPVPTRTDPPPPRSADLAPQPPVVESRGAAAPQTVQPTAPLTQAPAPGTAVQASGLVASERLAEPLVTKPAAEPTITAPPTAPQTTSTAPAPALPSGVAIPSPLPESDRLPLMMDSAEQVRGLGEPMRVAEPVTLPPQTAPRAEAARFAAQLADISLRALPRGVELSLSPEELGRVRMAMSMSEGGMVVSIAAERSETLELLRRHIDELGAAFRDLGHQDITFDFGTQDKSAGQDQNGSASGDLRGSEPDATDTGSDPSHHQTASASGLDLRL